MKISKELKNPQAIEMLNKIAEDLSGDKCTLLKRTIAKFIEDIGRNITKLGHISNDFKSYIKEYLNYMHNQYKKIYTKQEISMHTNLIGTGDEEITINDGKEKKKIKEILKAIQIQKKVKKIGVKSRHYQYKGHCKNDSDTDSMRARNGKN